MTKQEVHICDICGEIFYVPQENRGTLEINRGQNDEILFEICFGCHEKVLKMILEIRK